MNELRYEAPGTVEAAKEANTVELRTELGINDFARQKDRIER